MSTKHKLDFTEAIKKLQAKKSTLPQKIGTMAVNFFVANFNKAEWEGHKWDDVKRRIDEKGTYSDRNRGVLKGPGRHLYLSLKNSLRQANWSAIVLGVDLPYAAVHNEGLKAGRGAGFIMPKRQFIGNNKDLNKRIGKLINAEIKTIF